MERFWRKVTAAVLTGIFVLFSCPICCSGASAEELPVLINEVMSANDSAFWAEDGSTPDWVELINASESPVSLAGWELTDDPESAKLFTFPDQVLAPGECVLVLCDKERRETVGEEYHAPFALSRSGETLVLTAPSGQSSKLSVPALEDNQSYARSQDGSWEITDLWTPGEPNLPALHPSDRELLIGSDLAISEFMPRNRSVPVGSDGVIVDYIELCNTGTEDADLGGYHLSDDRNKVRKWTLPAGTVIKAGGYLTVAADGTSCTEQGRLSANFSLAGAGETVILSDPSGRLISVVKYDRMPVDTAFSLENGRYVTDLAPTPGLENTAAGAAAYARIFADQNTLGVYINEVSATSNTYDYDWVELYNRSSSPVDLSGCGLSKDPAKPMRWVFPQGTVIGAGGYLCLWMNGSGGEKNGFLCVSFKLGAEGGYTLCLSDPDGRIADRLFIPEQYQNISYGRASGSGETLYFTEPSPMDKNPANGATGRAQQAAYSVPGGLYDGSLTVELSAGYGERIYYTTDCTDPTEKSRLYTGPIQLSGNTVLRTRVYADGELPSYPACETYLFGVSHTVKVVSMVSDPDGLFSYERGIFAKGPGASDKSPYKGANFWKDWEREAHVEVYTPDGKQMLSQECGIKIQGQYSRYRAQKSLRVYARKKYSGTNTFPAALFSNRPYTEYDSFVLRSTSQDDNRARCRDSVLTALAKDMDLYYQETEVCVVYLNGEYWGHYNLREHVNAYSVCQFEGWEGQEDNIDLVKANKNVFRGSNETFADLVTWVKKTDMTTAEAYDHVASVIDMQNYIYYMTIEIYSGNGDTLNVKRYRNGNEDGKWRWILYDLDWAFSVDTDSIGRWLKPGGMGTGRYTDNTLFIGLMKNPRFKDEFLTCLGRQLATTLSAKNVVARFAERYTLMEPEMAKHCEKWSSVLSVKNWKKHMKRCASYAESRPGKLLAFTKAACKLSDSDMEKYFGEAQKMIDTYTREGALAE